ncbi:MAG TPA: fibronectin type III domain-containing protein [Candidatus Nanoperiomorbaceae bacterium]|nr:fibronectin type III domain-containing protein [Candidatus Nanoperiomorbaceae bacterium]HMQ96509.1 fibronectin type III domain-containing protein [Candidatus Nanoperiomorbaceae bacterium]HMR85926.1 fibronectin type III domain-containing protein [Candidatus Nanoperiomorbaceae bacterium]HMU11797.1 fibronectin type III domain-containing protein [Candidatus Nanoperiomorbaceae bacterium]
MTVIKRRYNGTWRTLGTTGGQTVPMAPIGVSVTSTISETIDVSWTAPPDNGGSPITGYTITYVRDSSGATGSVNTGAGVTFASISGLVADEVYSVTVHATNAVGTSAKSQPPVQVIVSVQAALAMPTATTVGLRLVPNRTLSATQALNELRENGTLSRVTVTGTFGLSGSDGINWVIEDCRFEGGNSYAIRGYTSGGAFTGSLTQRPVFRYCEVVGRAAHSDGANNSSACIYGDDMIFDHTDIYGGVDGIKARNRLEVRSSWVHDLDRPSGAHCDAVQIVSGVGSVFVGSRFDAYIGYCSDGSSVPSGDTASGMLQTGSVTGDISALWEHNWFAGGHYTVRGAGSDSRVEYTFRNNHFMRFGTSVILGIANLPPNRYGATYGGVTTDEIWENNVWDDTEEPVV